MTQTSRESALGFARLLRPYRASLAWIAALSLLGGLGEACVLVLILEAAVILSRKGATSKFSLGPVHLLRPSIGMLLIAATAATCIRITVQLVASWSSARLTAEVQRRLRASTFDAYLDAEWAVQAAEREGKLQQLLSVEVDRTTSAVLALATGLTAACSLLMLMVSAVVISPVAAAAIVGLVVGLFLGLRPITKVGRRWANARSGEELGMAQSLNELVRTAEEIRVHGVREPEKRRLDHETESVAGWVRRIQFVSLGVIQVYQGVALLLLVAALFLVDRLGASSLAGLGAIVLILLRSFAYSQQLQSTYHQLIASLPSVSRVQEQRARYCAQPVVSGDVRLREIRSLALESVSYRYRPDHAALASVSFEVSHGEVIGVIGPSGAGKSTLVQILLRLRVPDEGRYSINGQAATDYDEEDWTRLVSYVPQEPKVIVGTVADNIRFLRQGVSDDQVASAARLANLHDEVDSWPSRYDTVIGQRANAISGGQRQRLCLARALLSSPQMLILDEPTSALDAESEQIVQQTLESLRGRTTTFIVAHRMSTLRVCSRLLVLGNGHLEAFDTSANLAKRDGFYRRVVEILSQPGDGKEVAAGSACQLTEARPPARHSGTSLGPP